MKCIFLNVIALVALCATARSMAAGLVASKAVRAAHSLGTMPMYQAFTRSISTTSRQDSQDISAVRGEVKQPVEKARHVKRMDPYFAEENGELYFVFQIYPEEERYEEDLLRQMNSDFHY